jgi:hypothetical protein
MKIELAVAEDSIGARVRDESGRGVSHHRRAVRDRPDHLGETDLRLCLDRLIAEQQQMALAVERAQLGRGLLGQGMREVEVENLHAQSGTDRPGLEFHSASWQRL